MRLNLTLLRIPLGLALLASLAPAQEQRQIQKTVPLSPDGRLFVDTYKGSVEVETWDRSQAEIIVQIEADGWDRRSEEKVRDTRILIEDSPGSVRIKTDYRDVRKGSSWFGWESGSLPLVHYRIKMPATASLKIKDYKSSLNVKNLNAPADLYTYKGTVELREVSGPVDLETYKGECRVAFARVRASSFETYKGTIALVIPEGQGFDVDAKLGRRADLDSDFKLESSGRRSSRSDYRYQETVQGGGPSLKLRSYKGTYRLRTR